jgi:hypothetical protein
LRSFALHTLQTILSRQARNGQSPIIGERRDQGKRREINRPPYLAGEIGDAEINFWDSTGQAAFPHAITEEGQNQTLKNASPHKPHWQEWLPDSGETGLSLEQHMLLAISLMLVRTPTIVRSATFAQSVHQWLQEISQEQTPISSRESLSTHPISGNDTSILKPHITFQSRDDKTARLPIDNSTIGSLGIQEHKNIQGASLTFVEDTYDKENIEIPNQDITDLIRFIYRVAKHGKRMGGRQADQPVASSEADKSGLLQGSSMEAFCSASGVTGETAAGDQPPALPRREHLAGLGNLAWQSSTQHNLSQTQPIPTLSQATFQTPSQNSSTTPIPFSTTTFQCLPEKGLETAFGGLFYLINIGIYLELYADFTTPAQPGLPLTIWDFLALLGFRLLGATIQDDPIWPLLSLLAGRTEQEPPGTYFEPLADWRLPALWLNPFPHENSWQWAEAQGRLYVYHPAGFLILDIPIMDNREEQLKLEMQAYDKYGKVTLTAREGHLSPSIITSDKTSNPPGTSSQVVRWLDWLAPYLYARLQRALGTNDDPIPTMCMHNAHIAISTTHLDVYLSLATLPIEVRIAGLDRNPGWVPAAGRYVTFYFD